MVEAQRKKVTVVRYEEGGKKKDGRKIEGSRRKEGRAKEDDR
jgi:hypothetical protein